MSVRSSRQGGEASTRSGMPTGVKVTVGFIAVAGIAAFLALTQLIEPVDTEDEISAGDGSPVAAESEPSPGGVGASGARDEDRAGLVPDRIEGVEVGDDGVARYEPPLEIDLDEEVPLGLQERIGAFVAATAENLPTLVDDELTWLVRVDFIGSQLLFDYQLDINARTYPYEYWELPITDEVRGWECDGGTCFDFTDALRERACSGEAGALIRAGATGTHTFRDRNDLYIGRMTYGAADCAAVDG